MRSQLTALLLVVVSVSCATRRPPGTVNPNPPAIARFEHVFVVVEENQSYEDVIGNTADMPYLNTLATNYGVATNYYANTHPSLKYDRTNFSHESQHQADESAVADMLR